ncbi:hypothetical protein TWF128_006687 [Orbilia oligospora]|nr:hypothetical protein TWF128_006687 [Orbilia oligospora]
MDTRITSVRVTGARRLRFILVLFIRIRSLRSGYNKLRFQEKPTVDLTYTRLKYYVYHSSRLSLRGRTRSELKAMQLLVTISNPKLSALLPNYIYPTIRGTLVHLKAGNTKFVNQSTYQL